MVRVRYTGGGTYRVGGVSFGAGDVHDVDEETAEHLDGVEAFERVEDEGDEADTEEADDPPDVDEWADWNVDDWLGVDYSQREEDVREGRVDEHLDAVEECERSDTVLEAVEGRRDELEG